jgi:hypothetical protein
VNHAKLLKKLVSTPETQVRAVIGSIGKSLRCKELAN